MKLRRCLPLLLLCLGAEPALALDYRSLADSAILYDAPATKAKRRFVIARYTPVEVIVAVDGWVKIRNTRGDLAWVESRLLSQNRTVIVRADRAQVYAEADPKSAKVFDADRDVVLELVDANPSGWVKVKHRDGQGGFVKVSQVWGL